MKTVFALLACCAIGCGANGTGGDPGGDDTPQPDAADPGPDPQPTENCFGGNNCICPDFEACFHTCDQGALECHVQGSDEAVHVTCNDNAECHVECALAGTCEVECGGSAQCHVTCPPSGCTVTNCVGDCVVSCGGNGEASLSGTTATCP